MASQAISREVWSYQGWLKDQAKFQSLCRPNWLSSAKSQIMTPEWQRIKQVPQMAA